ncbi:MAG: hypothetical protein HRU38_05385 [Saccharospirillaceae bacterium]|nr:hypothetical protein [Saccharospirillaceae bacterium]
MNKYTLLTLIFLTLLTFTLQSFANTWKHEIDFDDNNNEIKIDYRISKIKENGIKQTLIEYEISSLQPITTEQCATLMLDIDNHRMFTDDKESKLIKKIEQDQFLIYYYTDTPWPMKNTDVVLSMRQQKSEKDSHFYLSATPDLYPLKKVKRAKQYDSEYHCLYIDENITHIRINFSSIPAIKVPKWMLNAAFPKIGFDTMKRFVTQAKQY